MDREEGSQLLTYKDFMIQRDLEIEMILEPGQYIIVPRTTGCTLKRPDNAEIESIRLMDYHGNFHPLLTSTITDIFNKFDLVISNSIDFKEFKIFLEIVGQHLADPAQFKDQYLSKYNSHDGGITLKGFLDWWKSQLVAHGEPAIWVWLEKLGYDRDLYIFRSKLYTISIHSRNLEGEGALEVKIRDAIGTDIDSKVAEMILEQYGEEESSGEGYKVLSQFSKATYSFSYGITNVT